MIKAFVGFGAILVILSAGSGGSRDVISASPVSSAMTSAAARDITDRCTITLSGNTGSLSSLVDASPGTIWTSSSDSTIQIETTIGISSVYIEWETLPESWGLALFRRYSFGVDKVYGEYGFMNEFVRMDKVCRKIRITLHTGGKTASIARLRVFSDGEPPETVQQWSPPLEKADMLVLPTHADDEHLYFGGTLPTYAGEQKKRVQVAYLTDCGTLRTRELLAGLWVAGIVNYPVISSYPDLYAGSYEEAARIYPVTEVLGYQVMLLRRFRPDVVIGHDLDGEYGHGMHIMNARLLTEALTLSGDPHRFTESAESYGIWEVKKCYLHLYEVNKVEMDWLRPLAAFEGSNAWEVAKLAYAEHVSQQAFKFRVRIEGPNDCRLFGLYYTTVGPDILKTDFFENIRPEPTDAITPVPSESAVPSPYPTSPAGSATVGPDPFSPDDSGSGWFRILLKKNPWINTVFFYLLFITLLIVLVRLIYAGAFKNKKNR
ncbi:MAG: PIG-L deacetylase family protein [Saccharofermentanales bacterium]